MSDEQPTPPTCSHCAEPMSEGFIADTGHHGIVDVATWIEGEPEKSLIGSTKTNFRNRFLMQAYRCPKCGRVELFAIRRRAMPM